MGIKNKRFKTQCARNQWTLAKQCSEYISCFTRLGPCKGGCYMPSICPSPSILRAKCPRVRTVHVRFISQQLLYSSSIKRLFWPTVLTQNGGPLAGVRTSRILGSRGQMAWERGPQEFWIQISNRPQIHDSDFKMARFWIQTLIWTRFRIQSWILHFLKFESRILPFLKFESRIPGLFEIWIQNPWTPLTEPYCCHLVCLPVI